MQKQHATARAQMYDAIKASVNGESKLQQCLNLLLQTVVAIVSSSLA
jgi:hypothetical protein